MIIICHHDSPNVMTLLMKLKYRRCTAVPTPSEELERRSFEFMRKNLKEAINSLGSHYENYSRWMPGHKAGLLADTHAHCLIFLVG